MYLQFIYYDFLISRITVKLYYRRVDKQTIERTKCNFYITYVLFSVLRSNLLRSSFCSIYSVYLQTVNAYVIENAQERIVLIGFRTYLLAVSLFIVVRATHRKSYCVLGNKLYHLTLLCTLFSANVRSKFYLNILLVSLLPSLVYHPSSSILQRLYLFFYCESLIPPFGQLSSNGPPANLLGRTYEHHL